MPRLVFDRQLNELYQLVFELSEITRQHFVESYAAYVKKDISLAEKSIASDVEVNKLYEQLDQKAIQMISQQQPVATDLRKIIGVIKIATDIERIADFAVNMSRASIYLNSNNSVKINQDIDKMYESMMKMFNDTFTAFMNNDKKLAQKVIEFDDVMDEHFITIINNIKELNKEEHLIEECLQLGFMARYLERTADHLTNIAENIIYIQRK